jgi:hypothetical protein
MHLASRPPRKPRRDGWTAERRQAFLDHLAAGRDVGRACALVGMSRQNAYKLRTRDAGFARGWDEARRAARDGAEAAFLALLPENLRRAVSEASRPCHLRSPAGRAPREDGSAAPAPIPAGHGECEHWDLSPAGAAGFLPQDPVPSVPPVSPSPRAETPDWVRTMLAALDKAGGRSLHFGRRSGRRNGC